MNTAARYFFFFSSLSLAAPLAAYYEDASEPKHWTVEADALYFSRVELANKKVVIKPSLSNDNDSGNNNDSGNSTDTDSSSSTHHKLHGLNTDAALDNMHYEPGFRVTAAYHNRKDSYDLSYMQWSEWAGKSHIDGPADLYFPFSLSSFSHDFLNASYASEEYKSQARSAEANWWYQMTGGRDYYFSFSTILGARYFHLKENYSLSMRRGSSESSYDISTKNNLFGLQAGGDLQWNPTDKMSWDLIPKLALFYNSLDQHTTLGDYNNRIDLAHYGRTGRKATFLADILLRVAYQINPSINLHAGYQLLYLAGLALAPEQITFVVRRGQLNHRLDKRGIACLHGFLGGITFDF